jgi:type IV secretory pathway VirB10-like protein
MQRFIMLACAALAFGMFASPLRAQQTPPGEPAPPTQQVAQPMPEQVQPPPVPEAEPLPPPPPIPPMPKARPSHRWVDIGDYYGRRSHHHARRPSHHRARTHHRRTHAHRRPAHKASRALHFSRRTVRSCHGMTYRQIMRHSSCRALMRQELAAAAHRHRHSAHRHRAITHRARHHHSARRSKR